MSPRSWLPVLLACLTITLTGSPAETAPGRSISTLLPSDTLGLVAFDLAALRKGHYWEGIESLAKDRGALEETGETVQGLSVDLVDHIDSVVVAFPNGFHSSKEPIVVLEGVLLRGKLERAVRKRGLTLRRHRHRGVRYWVSRGYGVAQLAGAVFIAPESQLRRILDVRGGALDSLATSKSFQSLVARVDASADAWALVVDAKGFGSGGATRLQGFALSVGLQSGMELRASARLSSAAEAKKAVAQAGIMRSAAVHDPTFTAMGLATPIQKAQLSQVGDMLNLHLTLTHEELEAVSPFWHVVKGQIK